MGIKTGLVMEGGAMRGMFTAGVIDVFMENGIEFDGAIGVSAGAVFGCNVKSKQIGRVIRYNKRFCRDKRFVSFSNWLKTGDLYPPEFDYETVPNELDVFDFNTYKSNPMDFYVVATDVNTGKPYYQLCNNGDAKDIQWMRASASMPVFSNVVEIDGGLYSDGGTSDSIPLKYFESIGYERNVVILTQPKGYVKKPYPAMHFISWYLRKYPELVKTLKSRHFMYNETTDYVEKRELSGDTFVIRPPEKLKVKPSENNPDELERVYQMGRAEALKHLEDVKVFVNHIE